MRPDPPALSPARLVFPPMIAAMIAEIAAWALVAWALVQAPLAAGWVWRPEILVAAHLLGLGVLGLSVLGAGWQLVAVLARRPLDPGTQRAAGWIDGAALVGIALLLAGLWRPGVLGGLGAALTIGALLARSAAVLPPLLRAPSPATRIWLVGAELSLWLGLAIAAALYAIRLGHGEWFAVLPVAGHLDAVGSHAALMLGGWIGGWILGLAGLLLPMFAVAPEPRVEPWALAGVLWFVGLFAGQPAIWAAGALSAAALLGWSLRRRLKPRLGPGLALSTGALLGLAATAIAALRGPLDAAIAAGFLLFALPMLRGVTVKILPFLAWGHLLGDDPAGAPSIESLVPERAAGAVASATALGAVLAAGGIALGQPGAASAGAILLLFTAAGHLGVIAEVCRRALLASMRRGAIPGTEMT